ncbi:hypothetical protein POSPLADRAFT_1184248 [Postia placenta MAD-698-R-SB12]|uniref:Uncharacterized protein n=1 Tax=Postia placenta MAD-698-R-SB12 TaxID=670580 RepID=A0A1X6MSX8_9APHY|nr:hypothetical protein POSPLADRAFT_1184248 [Postia placenta MAD-698-R-SB12]OSX59485.1 hypothetical protein POSPLADRAFT_1184248 [Postia placenta MAD-698-R-SB12]
MSTRSIITTFQALFVVELFFHAQTGIPGLTLLLYGNTRHFSKLRQVDLLKGGGFPTGHDEHKHDGRCDHQQVAAYRRRDTSCGTDDQPSMSPRCLDAVYRPHLTTICEVLEDDVDTHYTNSSQDGFHEMPNDLITESSASPPDLETFSERNASQDVLLQYQLDRRSLIIDSANPALAPHIVITPPDSEDAWDLYWASWQNRIGIQDTSFLGVPLVDEWPSSLASLPPLLGVEPESTIPTPQSLPAAVVVQAAASVALSFHVRWRDPAFRLRFERPFHWTDAAEPLLSFFSQTLGATVIDTVTPCTTPHIVIEEPAPEQCWALYHNSVPNPQDVGFGHYLTVPSSFVNYVNAQPDPFEEAADAGMEDVDSSSAQDSGGPPTPNSVGPNDVDLVMSSEHAVVTREDESEDVCHADVVADTMPYSYSGTGADGYSMGDDDDEGLPPFDDWYQSIASRQA